MQRTWGGSTLGQLFTRSIPWHLTLASEHFFLEAGEDKFEGNTRLLANLQVRQGVFWSTVKLLLPSRQPILLDGIPNSSAKEMASAVARAVRKAHTSEQIRNFDQAIQPILRWSDTTRERCKAQLVAKGWLTREFKASIDLDKPHIPGDLLREPEVQRHLESQPQAIQEAIGLWRRNVADVVQSINERHLAKELLESREFFNTVEKSPLTEEQARAVICMDNRVLLVASAGSGKTSTMVAKAGYVLRKGYFVAEDMLLLAFNNDAAAELRKRIQNRLEPLSLPSEKIAAKTFHAFGLDVIGQATGKRPSLAPWLENGRDLEALLQMVDDLKDRDPVFRMHWDLFRVVLGQDLPKFGEETTVPDAWDRENNTEGFWTLNGEVVKSRGEQLIANWLFYNGVRYQYEEPYRVDTADAKHRQYRPDFYLPDADAYLEHWAVDENGNPPAEFVGYQDGMAWKRQLHATHGSRLLETTMADLWSGQAFRYLSEMLPQLGVRLDPNPDRPVPGRQPIENPRLARTFRTFLTHAKSNRLTIAELRNRLASGAAGRFRFRHKVFLDLFEKLWAAWQVRLQAEQCIDFEDMLNLAAGCIEAGKWKSPYRLIMVDEFQDASWARARLIAGLLNGPDKHLFAVGDDWQSINRFAGSDLAVMTDFDARFGQSVTLKLETTFRCPQSLCDISSAFVQKNPKQLRKQVQSAKLDIPEPIRIIRVDDESKIRQAVARRIEEIAASASSDRSPLSVYVLGRYNKDRMYLPLGDSCAQVSVEFTTAHASKGMEADHVIIPRMTAETLGFPSRIVDDPVLQLAMPGGDVFEDAEERRLFYVALTRARKTVTLVTVAHRESSFIAELVRDHQLQVYDLEGEESASDVCPACRSGFLMKKNGKYGSFLGCSRYPKCRHTQKIAPVSRRPNHLENTRQT